MNIPGIEKWIDAIGDLGPYDLCPCGCGMKLRFVAKLPEEEAKKHEEAFIKKLDLKDN